MSIPKFRAFLKNNQKMYDVLTLDIIDEKVLIENNDNKEKPLRGYAKISEVEIVQSTGLKDDLLNEIFVGDVVCVDGEMGKVIFEDGMMMVEDEYGSRENLCDCSPIEVFGNIYENPEFLEGVKQ